MSYNLGEINRRRRSKGLRALSEAAARDAAGLHRSDSGFSLTDFLVGGVTGVAYNTSSAVGAIFHDSGSSTADHSSGSSGSDWGGGSGGDFSGGGSTGDC